MIDFGKYIIEKSKEYSEDLQFQLAFRHGAEEAMKWANEFLSERLKSKSPLN